MLSAVQWLVRRMAANYDRRITQRLRGYPACLLWFAAGKPEWPIPQRRELARELLGMHRAIPEQQHPAALGMARHFRRALEGCWESSGRICVEVYIFMRLCSVVGFNPSAAAAPASP